MRNNYLLKKKYPFDPRNSQPFFLNRTKITFTPPPSSLLNFQTFYATHTPVLIQQ